MNSHILDLVRGTISAGVFGNHPNGVDWSLYEREDIEYFWKIIEENRLGGQLRRYEGEFGSNFPGVLKERLSIYHRKTLFLNAMFMKTLIFLAPIFQREGIDLFVFKGVASQIEVYDEPFMNYTTDVDIYVPKRDYDKAVKILKDSGYRVDVGGDSFWWTAFLGEQHFRFPDAALMGVDLHHRVDQPGCPRPRQGRQFLETAELRKVGSVGIRTLGLLQNALFAALTLAKAYLHREPCGRHLADLEAGFLRLNAADKVELVKIARRQGLLQTLAFASTSVRAVFGETFVIEGLPGSRAASLVPADDFVDSLLDPQLPGIRWPRRAQVLIRLCDSPLQIPAVLGWKLASESWHRIFERRSA